MGKVDVISDEIIEDYNPKSAIFISYCFYIQPINSMQTHTHTHIRKLVGNGSFLPCTFQFSLSSRVFCSET